MARLVYNDNKNNATAHHIRFLEDVLRGNSLITDAAFSAIRDKLTSISK